MVTLAQTVISLETRREQVSRELARINQRLAAIASLLDEPIAGQTGSELRRSSKRDIARHRMSTAKRRSWFARREAVTLLRKAARSAKPAAELVRELAALKGYRETLSPHDMRRFEGATFMAIAQAIKAGALKRRRDGTLRAA
ncbi:MAG TPA: hypothetical protein VLW55_01195 [Burkholderiaceae bacterium]|nr:hypothetical protein [Burkholderiaceae bacterium]